MVLVAVKKGHVQWVSTPLYASPNPTTRADLWRYLKELGTTIREPWLFVGDVNQPLGNSDKRGGIPVSWRRSHMLWEVLQTGGLIDMGFSDPAFTWSNGREGRAKIQERIDRAWCNLD